MTTVTQAAMLLSLLLSLPAIAQDSSTAQNTESSGTDMGLPEKRALQSFQENEYPELTEEVNQAAGKTLKYEVKWDQLAEAGSSHLYEDSWSQIYFEPLTQALEAIAVDDIGKQAIQDGLEKVIIRNQNDCYSPGCWANLADKTLTLDHKLANVGDVDARAQELQTMLENNL